MNLTPEELDRLERLLECEDAISDEENQELLASIPTLIREAREAARLRDAIDGLKQNAAFGIGDCKSSRDYAEAVRDNEKIARCDGALKVLQLITNEIEALQQPGEH
jgi:hypothetical protein